VCGKGFQLIKRSSDELRKVLVVGFVDPAFERVSEDGDRDLGSEARGWVSEAAPAQRVGERADRDANLISSRSRSSAFAAMMV
jgi:hypothetical protein